MASTSLVAALSNILTPSKSRALVPVEQKNAAGASAVGVGYTSGSYGGGFGDWFGGLISEPFTGAWQRNIVQRPQDVLNFYTVFTCVSLISSDIGKLRIKLVELGENGIKTEVTSPAFSPLLNKPNGYQNTIQFLEQWVTSKLIHGNAYILKERDNRNVVVGLSVLDPVRTKPLVAPDGSVYYQLTADWLSGVADATPPVPASEIIHDRMNTFYHPLVGISPIYAAGLSASQGLHIQRNSSAFFANGARPGGILTAPARINDETAKRIKEHWQGNYTGPNAGNVAVLGDGLEYQPMVMTAVDAQLMLQLKMTAESVATTFHVPLYMVGLAEMPARVTVEAFNQQYYSQCLQTLIEHIEACLKEGLKLGSVQGRSLQVELDLDGLLRMDQAAQYKAFGDAVQATIISPNEARQKLDLPPKPGGDALFIQEQNYSVEAIAKRDAQDNPFGAKNPSAPSAPPADQSPPTPTANDNAAKSRRITAGLRKSLGIARPAA